MEKKRICAAAAKREIQLTKELFPIERFCRIHDPVHARVLYLEQEEDKAALVSLELTSLREYEIKKLKKLLHEFLDVEENSIWICVTHTFSAPHTRSEKALKEETVRKKNEQLCQAIERAVTEAAEEVRLHLQPVTVHYANGSSDVNICRDMETPHGWWLGRSDKEYSDKHLPVIRFDSLEGDPVAVLYGYDMQSSVMDGSLTEEGYGLISSDVAGEASCQIEARHTGATALFLLGAAGDQSPLYKARQTVYREDGSIEEIDQQDNGFVHVRELGKKLAEDVMKTMLRMDRTQIDGIQRRQCSVMCGRQKRPEDIPIRKPVKNYVFERCGTVMTPVDLFCMGDIAMIGVQPELSSITGHEIKQISPYPLTMVVTMVNGGAKYMPDARAYERITYEAVNSDFCQGSAEKLRDHACMLVKECRKGGE